MKEEIEKYIQWKATYAPRAAVTYRKYLLQFDDLTTKNVSSIVIGDVIVYQDFLQKKYSPYTIQFAMVALKNFLRYQQLNNVPCLSPDLIRLRRIIARSHRAITQEEYDVLISQKFKDTTWGLRDKLILMMLYDTGVRVSELCDLNIDQIDENKTQTTISTKKTRNKRIIVWSDKTHAMLMEYLMLRIPLSGSDALFITSHDIDSTSGRITPRTVQRVLKRMLNKAGIHSRLTPHSMRHGWAHRRRDRNAPIAFIQKGLGHISPVSSFVYMQYEDDEFEKNARDYLKSPIE